MQILHNFWIGGRKIKGLTDVVLEIVKLNRATVFEEFDESPVFRLDGGIRAVAAGVVVGEVPIEVPIDGRVGIFEKGLDADSCLLYTSPSPRDAS